MVRLIPSHVFVKDTVDVWGEEKTIGLAEHAVRTHAAALPFDRRGDIIYWDDFESATPKHIEDIGGAGTIGRSTTTSKFGSFSLKCATGATTNNYCQVIYPQVDYHDVYVGAQTSFACLVDNYDVRWMGNFYDGTNMHLASIKWTESTEKLAYWGSDAAYHDLSGTYPFYADTHSWATLKVVCDISSHEYVRLLFMDNEIELSDIGMEISLNATKRNFASYFKITTLENVAKTCYIDNFILTENEPA